MKAVWWLFVVFVIVQGPVMAQTPEEIQKQIDLLNKQRDLAKAEKERIDAEVALVAAKQAQSEEAARLAEQVAAAKAATDLSNAQKAAADARKAESDAALAAFKASIGEVPASGFTGGITAASGTGEIEATLLAARAVKSAATTIADAVAAAVPTGGTLVVFAVSEVPTFQNHIAYRTQRAIVDLALDRAIADSQKLGAPTGVQLEAAGVPLLGGAGLALDAVNKLLGFFRTDYTFAGVTVEANDLVAVTQVADLLAKRKQPAFTVLAPTVFNGPAVTNAGGDLIAEVTVLVTKRQLADTLAKKHEAEVEALNKMATDEKDAAKKLQLQRDAQKRKGIADALKGAATIFDTWFSKLTTADDKGVVGLVTVAKEAAIVKQLGTNGRLLALKVQKAGGGYMTKKSLWSFFAGAPLYHMGGAAVTYAVLDGTSGAVGASGVVPVYGGYVRSKDVAGQLAR